MKRLEARKKGRESSNPGNALASGRSVFAKTGSPASLGRFAEISRPPAVKFAPCEPLISDLLRLQAKVLIVDHVVLCKHAIRRHSEREQIIAVPPATADRHVE